MASASVKAMAQEECKIDLTPMIDMTFLLLIFFMCNKFKNYEKKLDSNLPTDEGLSASSNPVPLQQLRINIRLLQGAKDKVQITLDPATTAFKPIAWREGAGGVAAMFKDLENQVKAGYDYIGDKIEVAPQEQVPFEFIALTLDAIHKAQADRPDPPKNINPPPPGCKKRITFKVGEQVAGKR